MTFRIDIEKERACTICDLKMYRQHSSFPSFLIKFNYSPAHKTLYSREILHNWHRCWLSTENHAKQESTNEIYKQADNQKFTYFIDAVHAGKLFQSN